MKATITGYVLVNYETWKYVAGSGLESSYTVQLEHARVYPTREDAEKDRCVESETVRSLSTILGD